ncbi:MAG: hypothetical protein QW067_10385 [Thermofilaceae archaeon]
MRKLAFITEEELIELLKKEKPERVFKKLTKNTSGICIETTLIKDVKEYMLVFDLDEFIEVAETIQRREK